MKTIGHHTCLKHGGKEYVEKQAPFISTYTHDESSVTNYPFLGTGYYFWDNNIEIASWWGNNHCVDGYYIVKGELELNGGTFLDLVGNRSSMIWLKQMLETLIKKGYKKEDWTLGSLIEFLKEVRDKTSEEDIFPYNVIRSIDYNAKGKSNYFITFAPGKQSGTYLDPRIIICLIEKNNTILQKVSIVYESK